MLPHFMGIVCALGAATFATSLTRTRDFVMLVIGFAVAVVWLRPDPVWIGGSILLVALFRLGRSGFGWLSAAVAGVLAGLWGQVLQSYGLTGWVAVPFAAAVPGATAFLERRSPRFAPRAIREEALLTLCLLAVVLAAAPAVSTGWQAAVALNLEPSTGARSSGSGLGPWLILGLASAVSLGALHARWRRG